jgi:hypothetical protein
MAKNILALIQADRVSIAEHARAEALRFSWDRSMAALFNELYPAALARRPVVTDEEPLPLRTPLASA